MWMPPDIECPENNAEILTLDWEALGRLVRKRTEEAIAEHLATTEAFPASHASPPNPGRGRASELS